MDCELGRRDERRRPSVVVDDVFFFWVMNLNEASERFLDHSEDVGVPNNAVKLAYNRFKDFYDIEKHKLGEGGFGSVRKGRLLGMHIVTY